jgi:hypothetical protein
MILVALRSLRNLPILVVIKHNAGEVWIVHGT